MGFVALLALPFVPVTFAEGESAPGTEPCAGTAGGASAVTCTAPLLAGADGNCHPACPATGTPTVTCVRSAGGAVVRAE